MSSVKWGFHHNFIRNPYDVFSLHIKRKHLQSCPWCCVLEVFESACVPDQVSALSCEENTKKVTDVGNGAYKTCAIGTVRIHSVQTIQGRSDGEDGVD